MTRILSLATICAALLAPAASAQTATRDPATGDYRLTYTDIHGQTHTVTVEAADKVDPRLELTVEPIAAGWRYGYAITSLATDQARSPLLSWRMSCPPTDPALRLSAPPAISARVRTRRGPTECYFLVRDGGLAPGATVNGIVVESGWLPGILEIRVAGTRDFVSWPSLEGEVPEEAYRMVEAIQGGTGGWHVEQVVGPARDPAAAGSPTEALDGVMEDLTTACELGWITSDAVCHSLQVKLREARKALARSGVDAARGQLQSFLRELDAQHGPEAGKHVGSLAYALLSANVQHLLSRL